MTQLSPPATVESLLAAGRARIDVRLEALASQLEGEHPGQVGMALGYALRSPGKRVRPALVLAAYRAAGGMASAIDGVATAVEVVHTYSLVHDDLPCMDDDATRRGRPTTHVVFGVDTATRVGWLLVPVAVEALTRAAVDLGLGNPRLATMGAVLLEASGIRGMVGGQWLDLAGEGRQVGLDGLRAIHGAKTGALIQASCQLGGMAAGASTAVAEALSTYGRELGLAYQVADDLLDATATSMQLGKTAGRDAVLSKSTYVGELGIAGARREADALAGRAVEALERAGLSTPDLVGLARYVVTRTF
ncbi:MAG: polyprenyl synthetase family protein [Gemmatimonadota bacterium]|nr:polyprenyl synthetase family protein [Gemmatimonadota bacterium]